MVEGEVSLSRLESFFRGCELYQHFKGKIVLKVGEALHTETGETLYLYREFKPELENYDTVVWARPMGMFLENTPYSHKRRFKPITPTEAARLLYPIINKNLKTQ